ncbi:membrane protein [Gordonia phage Phistory]|uniref:Uncharacterized protein n=1 Tax=Gordonia phage Phistory TaxID=2301694 RepID=A0A385E247_9CAUD|nr:membrane protein [Gordonia phage Phistory]AXQ64799.1 hypothetical protein SEA_PHISTORY_94 [Gordonia phage Phistory]
MTDKTTDGPSRLHRYGQILGSDVMFGVFCMALSGWVLFIAIDLVRGEWVEAISGVGTAGIFAMLMIANRALAELYPIMDGLNRALAELYPIMDGLNRAIDRVKARKQGLQDGTGKSA